MSASSDLARRLKKRDILIDGSSPLGGWEDNYIIPGHTRECHPDFIATPIGDNPYGFLVCQRKKHETVMKPSPSGPQFYTSQSHNLYSDEPPSISHNGGQPRRLQDRRLPNQAHLQGADYYRSPIKYRGIGIEKINSVPGEFGYEENKYFYSTPPPQYDVTHAVQPYLLWKREQLRHGHFSPQQLDILEKQNNFINKSSTF